MKLHLNSFKCQFDESTKRVTVIDDTNFRHLIHSESIMWLEFNPDFVNEAMDQFVFCTQNKEWDRLVNKIYFNSDVKIVLHEIETPEDFGIYRYHYCNLSVIEYILHPSHRNRAFLNQVSHSDSESYFIEKLYNELSNPKSKINSFYKLKMFWNENHFTSAQPRFLSRRKRTLKWLSNSFPSFYCWIYENVVGKFNICNNRFRTDFLVSSKILIQQMMDEVHMIEAENEIELPF